MIFGQRIIGKFILVTLIIVISWIILEKLKDQRVSIVPLLLKLILGLRTYGPCHIRSHSANNCHSTLVYAPRLNPSRVSQYSIYLPRMDCGLSWPGWLKWLLYRDCLPVRRQSCIRAVTTWQWHDRESKLSTEVSRPNRCTPKPFSALPLLIIPQWY